MKLRKFLDNDNGQATILVIVLVLIVGMFIVFQTKTTPVTEEKNGCINVDTSKTIVYKNNTYVLIRNVSALSTEQFKWHITQLSDMTYNSQPVYRASTNAEAGARASQFPDVPARYFSKYAEEAKANPNQPASETYRRQANFDVEDMLFAEVGDIYSLHQDGYKFVEIFYKTSKLDLNNLPTFIKEFCDTKQPSDPMVIFPSKNGEVYPPATVSKSEIVPDPGKSVNMEDHPYTVFSYMRTDSQPGRDYYATATSRIGTLEKGGKKYEVHTGSFAGYIALIDEKDRSIEYLYSKVIPIPTPTPAAEARNTLQMGVINPSILQPWGWWSPECKPAIYLYPTEKTTVNVQVAPKGFLTYTDPVYPSGGWTITAYPTGEIDSNNKQYDYLYYESKILDSEVEKPTKGYVVTYENLANLYDTLLPQMGLNSKEVQDFKTYWNNKLPASPYYFVGVMTEKSIDRIEPLQVSPKPQTIVRVRLYFEALPEFKVVEEPTFGSIQRDGFTVVEWGGLVKLHPGTEFTCSQ